MTQQPPHPYHWKEGSRGTRPGLTRRSAAVSLPLAASAVALAACGPQAAPAENPQAPAKPKQTTEWWTGWGGVPANESFKKVEETANAQSRTYEVVHTRVSGVATKLVEVIVAGSPPDVEIGNLPYAEFWVQGYAEPLDQRLSKSKVIKKEDLPPAAWKLGGYKGKQFGVPAVEGFIRWGLAANEELLTQRGLDPAKIPTVWDELLRWHQQLTVVEGGALKQLGLDPLDAMGSGAGGPDPLVWGPSWGVRFWDEAKEQFNLTQPGLEEAVSTIKRFYDIAGGKPAIDEFRKAYGTWSGAKSGIASGTQAMQINGPWTPGELAKNAPDKRYVYTWVAVPNARKGKKIQSTGGHFANLPKGSPHPDEAFQFIEFVWSDQAMDIIFDGTGWLTARKSYLSKVDTSKYRGLDFYVKSVTQADEMWAAPVNPIDGFFRDAWRAHVGDVLSGKMSPKSALQELQRLCSEELSSRTGKR
ncbi:MAG TPA: extracellular solute-binding protein [Chloroflexota bacterium]|nr:extracellular solute-binding protein [Chloroflexota bacterium]